MRRIGLFGGTFDPIHIGHLRTACEIAEALELDQVEIMPCATPPHKKKGPMADAPDRLEMIRLAVEGQARLKASDRELGHKGPSYTVNTIRELTETTGKDTISFFILGQDAFFEIHTWKSFQALFRLVPLAVVTRPSGKNRAQASLQTIWGDYLDSHVARGYAFAAQKECFEHPELKPVHLVRVTPLMISATMIRDLCSKGRSISYLVTREVETYIQAKGLYR